MAVVEFQNVSKTFMDPRKGAVSAVHDFSLTVASGELLVLLGPSGSGKTTMLRLLAGLETPTSGTIAIDGHVVNCLEPKQRNVAMVFQHHALYPHLTVFENLAFGLRLRRVPWREIELQVRAAAAALGRTALLDRLPEALSGGERQRVAVGRALVRRPRVYLFDEPLSSLDATLRLHLRTELKRLQFQLGTTTLYVTHDQAEAMTMAHRLAVMQDGHLEQVGEPLDVYHHPRNLFVAGFVGSPPMNLFPGVVTVATGLTRFQPTVPNHGPTTRDAGWLLCPDHQPHLHAHGSDALLLGLRPEAILPASLQPGGPGRELASLAVQVVEPLGGECLIHGLIGTLAATARWPCGSRLPKPGEALPVCLDLAQAHYFDPDTGIALSR